MAVNQTFVPTDEQQRITDHDFRKHARVLAGPGTGKSTTLLAMLDGLKQKDESLNLRMLTFTRATTTELMKKSAKSGNDNAYLISTIHSFAISTLLRNEGSANIITPLRFADDWEQTTIIHPRLRRACKVGVKKLRSLLREMESNWERLEAAALPSITEQERQKFLGAWRDDRRLFGYTLLSELPFALLAAMEEHDDLVGLGYDMLVVDEYQDLNACDVRVISEIAKRGAAIVAAGDDDQSVYSFRSAAPEGIRKFTKEYPNVEPYPLTISLRCGTQIIDWATKVIQSDPSRPAKQELRAKIDGPPGERALLRFDNDVQESLGVKDLVIGLNARQHVSFGDILILARGDDKRMFSKPITDALTASGVQVNDPGLVREMLGERQNRWLMACMRLCENAGDSLAWATILKLERGVGETLVGYIEGEARPRGWTFGQALLSLHGRGYPGGPRSVAKLGSLVESLLQWASTTVGASEDRLDWGQWMLSAVDGEVVSPPTPELTDLLLELDQVREIETSLGQYVGQIGPTGTDLMRAKDHGVRFMTMGAAKGLTVAATIVVGVENDIIPGQNVDLEEERRRLYVAMTRPTDYLYCTWARRRSGQSARAGSGSAGRRRSPSEFLADAGVRSVDGNLLLKAQGWR